MVYCSSVVDACDRVKSVIQKLLRDASVVGDTVVLTGSDGIMMKSWLVDLFSDNTTIEACKIAVVAGTSAINCGVSSPQLHYICVKGFLQSLVEFVQLVGCLKYGTVQILQDRIDILLSLSQLTLTYSSILIIENDNERNRQVREITTLTVILTQRKSCIFRQIEEYYGAKDFVNEQLSCNTLCHSCRGESDKTVKRLFLIDHMEVDIFNNGTVILGKLA